MTKRAFLELVSGLVSWPALAPLAAWAQGERLTNWAGNLRVRHRQAPRRSLARRRAGVRAEAVEAQGARHAPLLQHDRRQRARLPLARRAGRGRGARRRGSHGDGRRGHRATASSARTCTRRDSRCTTSRRCRTSRSRGPARRPRTARARRTATSRPRSRALELVTAAGDLVTLSADSDDEAFRGAVVGLGALGVVTKVTLDVEPAFAMRQWVYENLPLAQLKEHFDAIMSSALQRQPVHRLAGPADQRGLGQEPLGGRPGVRGAPAEFFGAKRATPEPAPDRRALRRELHRAAGRARAPGTSGCRTSGWASRRARARSCSRSTSFRARTRSTRSCALDAAARPDRAAPA